MTNWEHLQDIEASLSSHLEGKLVALAVCGSIAAIEVHRLARQLIRHGAKVQIFLTKSAAELVSSTSLAWCTGRPVIQELSARCEHLEYFGERGQAELLLIAPITANTLAKVALGLDDNVVTTCVTTALGNGVPVMCAPGMHEPMMRNPAVQRNLALAVENGVEILNPTLSEGKQKMMPIEEIIARVLRRIGPQDLKGKRVVLSGGPTREFIDPARCLTNPSSGLSACLLAEEAYRRGAEVALIYGPGSAVPASWLKVERVSSSVEMLEAVKGEMLSAAADYFLAVAAVSDFRPVIKHEKKRCTSLGGFSLSLETTPKIIDVVRELYPATRLVAFKAASSRSDEELLTAVRPYLEEGRADVVVGNSVVEPGLGFDSSHNRYLVCIPQESPLVLGPSSKLELSQSLWDVILRL